MLSELVNVLHSEIEKLQHKENDKKISLSRYVERNGSVYHLKISMKELKDLPTKILESQQS